jgi:hypothetical protein
MSFGQGWALALGGKVENHGLGDGSPALLVTPFGCRSQNWNVSPPAQYRNSAQCDWPPHRAGVEPGLPAVPRAH